MYSPLDCKNLCDQRDLWETDMNVGRHNSVRFILLCFFRTQENQRFSVIKIEFPVDFTDFTDVCGYFFLKIRRCLR